MLSRFLAALRRLFDTRPRSFWVLQRERRLPPTRNLYVLEVDFSLDDARARELDRGLDLLRSKYGLDFFVIEPGIKLKRFDDI